LKPARSSVVVTTFPKRTNLGTGDGVAIFCLRIGIPEKDLDHIFDLYYRADSVTDKIPEGLGLGLYVAREVAGLHGGFIKVSSKVGVGSCFTLVLPIKIF
jgi:signal transduction histidine kinase